eukprot:c6272_g1_i1.p1 GENE.c6272_g1_i1~~c6272_g1_i1.p1  ORF type:complete len:458 (-),score=72.10 c6272_g1_i1:346-1719(-)
MGSMAKQFVASWPAVFVSNLHVTFWLRRAIWLYIFSSLIYLVSLASVRASKATWEFALLCLPIVACLLMGLITAFEFDVCGLRSFGFSLSALFIPSFFIFCSGSLEGLKVLAILIPLFWSCFSSALHFICGLFVLPAQLTFNGLGGRFPSWRIYEPQALARGRSQLIDILSGEVLKLTTPDGVNIDAMFFASKTLRAKQQEADTDADQLTPLSSVQAPTVILFNGNNESFEFKQSEIEMYLYADFSVLAFNYRGVSASKGFVTRDGTVLDGETCYQYVNKRLHVPDEFIHLIGTSLGAAVATEVAALHKGCSLCSDRSFACLTVETQEVAPAIFGLPKRSREAAAVGSLVSSLMCFSGWEFRAYKQWHRVSGPKFLMFHPEDTVIPERARLYTFLKSDPTLKVIQLRPDLFRTLPEDSLCLSDDEGSAGQYAHCRALTDDERRQHFALLGRGNKILI